MSVSVCLKIDRQMQNIVFLAFLNETIQYVLCKTRLNQFKRQDKRLLTSDHQFFLNRYSVIRNRNRDQSSEKAIFVLYDLRVDNITEQLYFYSMNSPIQWPMVIKTI